MVVNEDTNGRRYYVHNSVEISKIDDFGYGGRYKGSHTKSANNHRSLLRILAEDIWFGKPNDKNKFILNQISGNTYRGAVRFDRESGQAMVKLFAAKDPSTFVHEFGHVLLNDLALRAASGSLNESEASDWSMFLNWAGIESWSTASDEQIRDAHERFSRAVEQYFWEGVAPDPFVFRLFKYVSSFMRQVYDQASAFDVDMSPEVRQMFDHMFGLELNLVSSNVTVQPGTDSRTVYVRAQAEPQMAPEADKTAQVSVIRRIIQLYKNKSTAGNTVTEEFKDVPVWLTDAARVNADIDIRGYRHSIGTDSLSHIFKRHGNSEREAKAGQVAVTENDIEKIPDVIAEPDYVAFGNKTNEGLDAIIYVKVMPDGNVFYVEEVRTGRKQLNTKSMYIKKMTGTDNGFDAPIHNVLNATGATVILEHPAKNVNDAAYDSNANSEADLSDLSEIPDAEFEDPAVLSGAVASPEDLNAAVSGDEEAMSRVIWQLRESPGADQLREELLAQDREYASLAEFNDFAAQVLNYGGILYEDLKSAVGPETARKVWESARNLIRRDALRLSELAKKLGIPVEEIAQKIVNRPKL